MLYLTKVRNKNHTNVRSNYVIRCFKKTILIFKKDFKSNFEVL